MKIVFQRELSKKQYFLYIRLCKVIIMVGFFVCEWYKNPHYSIYFIAFMALGCSLMWPALWPLAMTDLGKFTKAGSSLMVIAIVGGALIPTIYGLMKDSVGAQAAYWICVPCFLYILYYGLKGHKIRTK